jgi:hypothetical protein
MSSITTPSTFVAYVFPLVKRHGVRSVIRKPGSEALERRLAKAKLRHRACVEDIDPAKRDQPRGLDRTLLRSLAQDSAWVREHEDIFLIGPTGIGISATNQSGVAGLPSIDN